MRRRKKGEKETKKKLKNEKRQRKKIRQRDFKER